MKTYQIKYKLLFTTVSFLTENVNIKEVEGIEIIKAKDEMDAQNQWYKGAKENLTIDDSTLAITPVLAGIKQLK